jgi:hypothetical protein
LDSERPGRQSREEARHSPEPPHLGSLMDFLIHHTWRESLKDDNYKFEREASRVPDFL